MTATMKNSIISGILIAVLVMVGTIVMVGRGLRKFIFNIRLDNSEGDIISRFHDVNGIYFRPAMVRAFRGHKADDVETCIELDEVERRLFDFAEKSVFFLDPNLDTAKLASMVEIDSLLLLRYFDSRKTTFAKFVGDLRSNYARQYMLSNPDASLNDVLSASGFPSMKQFRSSFANCWGVAPESFRFQYVRVSDNAKCAMAGGVLATA